MRLKFFQAAVVVMTSLSVLAPAMAQSRNHSRNVQQAPRGERLYTVIDQHNPARFSKAVRIAGDSMKHGGRGAEIMLVGRAILMVVPGFTDVQKEIQQTTRRYPALKIIACKETVDVLRKSNQGRQPPMIAGVRVESCTHRVRKNDSAGWQRMLGL